MYKIYSQEIKKCQPVDQNHKLAYSFLKGGICLTEKVLVIKTELLPLFQTKYLTHPGQIHALLEVCQDNYLFLDRPKAETDPSYKQLITYVTLLCSDSVMALQRTTAQSEKRLHGKLSLGVGGHINKDDDSSTLVDIISRALFRELKEELWLDTSTQPTLQGIINDDSNSVGTVHIGLHYILHVQERPLVRETAKMTATWYKPSQLAALRPHLETWSQILLPALTKIDHL